MIYKCIYKNYKNTHINWFCLVLKERKFHAFRRWLKRDFIFYKGCENQKDTKAIKSQYFAQTQVSFHIIRYVVCRLRPKVQLLTSLSTYTSNCFNVIDYNVIPMTSKICWVFFKHVFHILHPFNDLYMCLFEPLIIVLQTCFFISYFKSIWWINWTHASNLLRTSLLKQKKNLIELTPNLCFLSFTLKQSMFFCFKKH